MRLRYLFVILALLVLAPTLLLLFFSAEEDGTLIYIANVLAVVAVLFLIFFYRRVLKPLDTIADGMDLLAAQDFSSSLSPVGQAEADRIVLLFNRLMARIKEERLTLLEQNGFLSLLIEESPMGVILLDFDNRITLMNTSARRFLEVDDCTGCELQQLPSPLVGDSCNISIWRSVRVASKARHFRVCSSSSIRSESGLPSVKASPLKRRFAVLRMGLYSFFQSYFFIVSYPPFCVVFGVDFGAFLPLYAR